MSNGPAAFLNALHSGCEQSGVKNLTVLVAVSGGADSVALLRGLVALRETLHLSLQVAHLNHQLRGAESDADALWVTSLAGELGLTCHPGSESIQSLPELPALGLEGTARLARNRFLQATARDYGCDCIALAHTASDQAETILHHILRGTGLAGLGGMLSQEIPSATEKTATSTLPVVRPMLGLDRGQVEHYLQSIGQSYRNDSTNTDTRLTRNRIRHELLPSLAREFNPQIQTALLRLGQQARDVYSQESLLAELLLEEVLIEMAPGHCRLRCQPLAVQPDYRVREVFVRLWCRLNWPRRQMGYRDWDRVRQMVTAPAPPITLPGKVTVSRRDDLLMLQKE